MGISIVLCSINAVPVGAGINHQTIEAGFGVTLVTDGALPSVNLLQKSFSRTIGQTATLAFTVIPVLNIESDEGGL